MATLEVQRVPVAVIDAVARVPPLSNSMRNLNVIGAVLHRERIWHEETQRKDLGSLQPHES